MVANPVLKILDCVACILNLGYVTRVAIIIPLATKVLAKLETLLETT
ncbi:hypothetical protein Q668_21155 [Alcanivorax sp. PN-3]|nr:hypothetical protein Q668_21155 [Alcanivorax sp. PN-3]